MTRLAIAVVWLILSFAAWAAPAPQITGISPNPVTGSASQQSIIVQGANFQNGLMITVAWASGKKVLDANQVRYTNGREVQMLVTTTTSADTWAVYITNPDKQNSNTAAFRVVSPAPPLKATPPPLSLPPLSTTTAVSTPQTSPASPASLRPLTNCGSKFKDRVGLQVDEVRAALVDGYSFDAACQSHDACYDQCEPRSLTHKNYCDQEFDRIMAAICDTARFPGSCNGARYYYYDYVSNKAGKAYAAAGKGCPSLSAKVPPAATPPLRSGGAPVLSDTLATQAANKNKSGTGNTIAAAQQGSKPKEENMVKASDPSGSTATVGGKVGTIVAEENAIQEACPERSAFEYRIPRGYRFDLPSKTIKMCLSAAEGKAEVAGQK